MFARHLYLKLGTDNKLGRSHAPLQQEQTLFKDLRLQQHSFKKKLEKNAQGLRDLF